MTVRMPRSRLLSALSIAAVLVAGCADPEPTGTPPPSIPEANTMTPSDSPDAAGRAGTDTANPEATRISLNIGDTRLTATLDDNPAARDLVAQLPLSLTMSDHGSIEKTGKLPAPLSTTGLPAGTDPSAGDLGYYAPWNNLVLYYGDQSYHDGIVRLGTLHGDIEAIGRMNGDVAVRIVLS